MPSPHPTCFHCLALLPPDDEPTHVGGGWGALHHCGSPECLAVLDAFVLGVECERALEWEAREDEWMEREGGRRIA